MSRARSVRPWSATGLSTGTPSFIAANTIACSAMAPLSFEFITNICSHRPRTESRPMQGNVRGEHCFFGRNELGAVEPVVDRHGSSFGAAGRLVAPILATAGARSGPGPGYGAARAAATATATPTATATAAATATATATGDALDALDLRHQSRVNALDVSE